jgi:polyhydroxyalkanoate synthesis regulator phasin
VAASRSKSSRARQKRGSGGLSGLAEQLVERILRPLGLVVLSRERIQETLEEAAERGRVTRSDANELAAQLMQRGRQQTEELLGDIDRLLGRGREQLDSATLKARRSKSVDRLVRGADRARRTVGVGRSFPIGGYDDLTAPQVRQRLGRLDASELRKVRNYERRHANRKSVLARIEKLLG